MQQREIVDERRIPGSNRDGALLRIACVPHAASRTLQHRERIQRPRIVGARDEGLAGDGLGARGIALARAFAEGSQLRGNEVDQRIARTGPLGVDAVAKVRKARSVVIPTAAGSRRAGVRVPFERLRGTK